MAKPPCFGRFRFFSPGKRSKSRVSFSSLLLLLSFVPFPEEEKKKEEEKEKAQEIPYDAGKKSWEGVFENNAFPEHFLKEKKRKTHQLRVDGCPPDQHGRLRVEPHRLINHPRGPPQLWHVVERRGAVLVAVVVRGGFFFGEKEKRVSFFSSSVVEPLVRFACSRLSLLKTKQPSTHPEHLVHLPRHLLGVFRPRDQAVDCPRQHRGGGLVAGDQQRHQVVAELLRVERVSRGEQKVQDRRVPVGEELVDELFFPGVDEALALGDEAVEGRVDDGEGLLAAALPRDLRFFFFLQTISEETFWKVERDYEFSFRFAGYHFAPPRRPAKARAPLRVHSPSLSPIRRKRQRGERKRARASSFLAFSPLTKKKKKTQYSSPASAAAQSSSTAQTPCSCTPPPAAPCRPPG